jgi:hypothetical protein
MEVMFVKRVARIVLMAVAVFALAGLGLVWSSAAFSLAGTSGPTDPDVGAAPTVFELAGTSGPTDPDVGAAPTAFFLAGTSGPTDPDVG